MILQGVELSIFLFIFEWALQQCSANVLPVITGCTATAHGRSSGFLQVVPVCTPPNRCFLGPTRVQIPNSISIGSAAFAQMTAECGYTSQRAAPFLP